jgi:tetratricopeptide (TPR) repeat protein
MKHVKSVAAVSLAALLWASASAAQSSSQSSSSSSRRSKGTQPAPPAASDNSDATSRRINNTAPAEHDVEVGQYYLKKEKYDAAIDRFKEATRLLPDYGLAYRLMGEAYEKKKFLPEAQAAYKKFLEVAPQDKDAGEVRKRLERLQAEIQQQDRRRAAATKP